MKRYIDADALCEYLQNKLKTDYEMGLYNHGALTESFIRFVERQPTANVAPIADTVQKMQERLKEEMENLARMESCGEYYFLISKKFIDSVAKEMLEDST